MGQIVVNTIQSQVYGMFGLVVHTNAYKDLDAANLRELTFHHLHAMDEPIPGLKFPQQVRVHKLGLVTFRAIINSDWFSILEQRNFGIVDPLVGNTGTTVDIDCGVNGIISPIGLWIGVVIHH